MLFTVPDLVAGGSAAEFDATAAVQSLSAAAAAAAHPHHSAERSQQQGRSQQGAGPEHQLHQQSAAALFSWDEII